MAIASVGFSTTWIITNSGTTFTPATITINLGDSVKFNIGTGHNVVEVSQTTWNDNGNAPLPGFSLPFGGGLLLPVQLTTGTHYFVCSPHASFGMKGTIIVQNTSGISDNPSKTNISIFPNPSNGKFQVDVNTSQVGKSINMDIYNAKGNKVFASTDLAQNKSNLFDLSSFPSGIYYLKFLSGSETICKKIIIQ